MPRRGEARDVSDKQEWERGLFGQLLSNSTGSKTLIPIPLPARRFAQAAHTLGHVHEHVLAGRKDGSPNGTATCTC